jgi:GntR family transcriptional regulator, transcriptional repressor for pyruvate dehydrogenase complex
MAVDDRKTRFGQVSRGPSLSDQVAATLTDLIISGELPSGHRMPSERELVEEFAVSRSVVREAVRSLVARGLVTAQARSGHIVSLPGTSSVTDSLMLYMRGRGALDFEKVMEVREVLEVETAGRAAAAATGEEIEALRLAAQRFNEASGAEEAALADVEFHRMIAVATGNEYFEIVLDSLRGVLLEVQLPSLATPEILGFAREAHAAVLERIVAHDAEGARAAMERHLSGAVERARSLRQS